MTYPGDEYRDDPEPFWQVERVNERDDWDQHLRAVELEERERVADHE